MREMEHLMEWDLARETELPEENVSQGHFVFEKSHMN
jgi:hypothetical protein